MRSINRAIVVVVASLGGLLAVQTSNRFALGCAAGLFAVVVVILLASPIRTMRYDYAEKRAD